MQDTLRGITIDDRTTRDMDDAIWVEPAENGGWRVAVMIADVAKAVPPRSKVDRLAMSRAETRYYAGGNSPMLPMRLADQELSLWPGRLKDVLVIDVTLDDGLGILDTRLSRGMVDSEAKLAYSDIPGILSDREHPQHAVVERAMRLARGLLAMRRRHGALVFYDLTRGWVTSEEGSLKQLRSREDTVGYVIVQELMILANVAVAEYAVKNNVPILFRNHMARSATPEREGLMRLLESAAVVPAGSLASIEHTTRLMLSKAEYGAVATGHFGLNLGAYAHFTSPIRRYADLVNHQQIRAHIKGRPMPYTKEEIGAIALYINRKLIEHDKARGDRMREKADRRAEAAVLSGRIEDVSDNEFEHITKLLVRSGEDCPEAYSVAFKKRLDRMPVLCAGLVLTQGPEGERWAGLKAALLERAAKEPNMAVTIFNIAGQVSGWQMPSYTVAEAGSPPIFTAKAAVRVEDRQHESAEFKDMTKKGAMQRASVGLLAAMSGMPVPEMSVALPAQQDKVEKCPAVDTSKDPIVALQEYSQAKKLPLPDYSFKIDGPAGKQAITCTCTFGTLVSAGQASSKQRAKRLAAKAVVSMLSGAEVPAEEKVIFSPQDTLFTDL